MFPNSHISRHFFYADPAIGGGKTHSLKKHLSHPFTGKSIVGIQSIELAKEIEKTLKEEGIPVLRIDTEAFPYDPEAPTVTCTSIFNEALESGLYQVLIANYEVVLRAKEPYCREYALFMDEVTPVHERIWLDGIVTSHHNVASYLTSEKTDIKGYRKIRITDEGEHFLAAGHLEKMFPGEKEIRDAILKAQNSDHYDLYAEDEIYSDFREALKPSLVLHSVMKPAVFDRFARVTILGANFLWSLMNLIWSKHYAVEFSLHQQIMTIGDDGIRYQDLKHKAASTTVYYHSDKNCSKTLYKQVDYQPTFNASHDAFKALLAEKGMPEDTKHLVFLNNKPKGYKGKFYWKDEANSVPLSPAARGWDAYKDIDVAIYLAACNEHPDSVKFLMAFYKLSKAEIDRATAMERAYQAIGRCAVRDMNSNRPVHLIFFEYRAAKFVADLIGCGEPVFLNTGLEGLVSKEPKTKSERNATAYHNKNVKAISELPNYDGFNRRKWMHRFSKEFFDDVHCSWGDWVADSRDFAETNTPEKKEMSVMYREGSYKSGTNHLTKGNIESTKVITLDFDESADPQEFSNWLASRNIPHLIVNSWSSAPDAPRFRLDIPLDRPVNSYGYSHIVSHLLKEIADEFGDAFIADDGKLTMLTRFHMPAVSVFAGDLFIDGSVMNGDQYAFLDVMAYMDRGPVEEENPVIETETKPVAVARVGKVSVEEIMDKWAVAEGFEKGSINFYNAGIDLIFKAGLSPEEAIQELHINRCRFGKGDDRDAACVVRKIMEDKRAA